MLNAEQVAGSIQRIIQILGAKAKEDLPGYVTQILEVCGFMEAFKFEEVCKEIVRTWRNAWRPKPSEYLLMYNRLSKDRNWGAASRQEKCPSCEGTSYVTAWYVRTKPNAPPQPIEAVKPCPECRRGAADFIKTDLREIEREQYDALRGKKCFHTKWAELLASQIPKQPAETVPNNARET